MKRKSSLPRFLAIFIVLGGLGIGAMTYVLIKQRAPVPFRDVYTLKAEFVEANGVVEGIGQPVNVAGVKVGQVVGTELRHGRALIEMQIQRDRIPQVYANATVRLEPVTPLNDMQLNLDPGRPPAAGLADGATLGADRTDPPVALTELLSTLDADTRAFLTSLIKAMDQGTRGRGMDIRRMFRALGPTYEQVGSIGRALAERRRELARLVHNLASVSRAATRDERLADLVVAGNRTLESLAAQEVPLRQAIAKLPRTLAVTRSSLVSLEPFARKLGPALDALLPSTRRLPDTFAALRPLASTGTSALRNEIRPLISESRPLVRTLARAVPILSDVTPMLSRSFQVLTYFMNELAYNPPGDDEGFLFWTAWMVHNMNSALSTSDAHGGIFRGSTVLACEGVSDVAPLSQTIGLLGLCPE